QALGHHDKRFQPLVVRQLAHRRWHGKDFAARAGKALAEIETKHLVDAFEADVDIGPSSAIDSVSNQPRAVIGLPSGPSIGAASTSSSPVISRPRETMRPGNQP